MSGATVKIQMVVMPGQLLNLNKISKQIYQLQFMAMANKQDPFVLLQIKLKDRSWLWKKVKAGKFLISAMTMNG